MDDLALHGHHIWLIVGILLALGELMHGGFVLLWFAGGALVAALFSYLETSFKVQLIAFSFSSLGLFAASRTIFRRFLMGRKKDVPTNVDAMIGRKVQVVDEIGPGRRQGSVQVAGEVWSATSTGKVLRSGEIVVIEAIEGLKVQVREVDASSTASHESGERRQ
jgi:membrane protein implicated in regulation of membrane protease activity